MTNDPWDPPDHPLKADWLALGWEPLFDVMEDLNGSCVLDAESAEVAVCATHEAASMIAEALNRLGEIVLDYPGRPL